MSRSRLPFLYAALAGRRTSIVEVDFDDFLTVSQVTGQASMQRR